MSKKKSRRQRKNKLTTTVKPSTHKSEVASKKIVSIEPEMNKYTSEQDNIGLSYIRSDIRKTVVLSGFIIVFYTVMYYLLQRTALLGSIMRLLGFGS
jgi:hypothetical protein